MIRTEINSLPDYDFFCTDNENICDHINIIHERIKLLSETVNKIIVPQENSFPSAKDLQKIKYNTRLKNLMKRIIKRNEHNYNYIIITEPPHSPETEHFHEVELDFLSKKGYKIYEKVSSDGYYCKISW